jgi:sugar-specific transcriptional regulator TrmB
MGLEAREIAAVMGVSRSRVYLLLAQLRAEKTKS